MIFLLLIFLLGLMTPIQTAANSRLRQSVCSPLIASLVSFSVGTFFLAAITLMERGSILFPLSLFSNLPWWAWLGGVCGLYGLTVNIIIFPKLGSVQTALMPMLGQICTGLLIDHFGLLRASVHEFGAKRAVSLVLVLVGVLMVVLKRDAEKVKSKGVFLWQAIGFSGGAIFAMQPSMNSLLSGGLSSAIHAAWITFFTATVLLSIIVFSMRSSRIYISRIFSSEKPWWSWLGGIIGGIFVTGFAFFADKVSIGVLLVTSICGMLAMSIFIDKYGLFSAPKKAIGIRQYIGLLLIVGGVALLRLN